MHGNNHLARAILIGGDFIAEIQTNLEQQASHNRVVISIVDPFCTLTKTRTVLPGEPIKMLANLASWGRQVPTIALCPKPKLTVVKCDHRGTYPALTSTQSARIILRILRLIYNYLLVHCHLTLYKAEPWETSCHILYLQKQANQD